MKVLQVISDNERRGAQIFARDLGEAIRSGGWDVETVALVQGREARLGFEVLGRRPRGLWTILKLRSRMARADVTIAHGSTTAAACALASSRKRRFVYRQIGDTRFWTATPARRARASWYLQRAARVVALSEASKEGLVDHLKLDPARIEVVPNAVSADRFKTAADTDRHLARQEFALPLDAYVVGCVGALSPEKNVAAAVLAVARLDHVHLLIAGVGPEEGQLRELASRHCPGRVHFVGLLEDPVVAYQAVDLLLMPSWSEGMPAVLIEAALSGLPVVASNVGSVREIVRHGETGILLDFVDAARLGEAVSLLESNCHRRALGEKARSLAIERFSVDSIAKSWMEILRGLISEG